MRLWNVKLQKTKNIAIVPTLAEKKEYAVNVSVLILVEGKYQHVFSQRTLNEHMIDQ